MTYNVFGGTLNLAQPAQVCMCVRTVIFELLTYTFGLLVYFDTAIGRIQRSRS